MPRRSVRPLPIPVLLRAPIRLIHRANSIGRTITCFRHLGYRQFHANCISLREDRGLRPQSAFAMPPASRRLVAWTAGVSDPGGGRTGGAPVSPPVHRERSATRRCPHQPRSPERVGPCIAVQTGLRHPLPGRALQLAPIHCIGRARSNDQTQVGANLCI